MMRGVPRGVVRDMFKRLRAAAALGAPIDDMGLIIYTLVVVRLRAAAASGVPIYGGCSAAPCRGRLRRAHIWWL